MTNVFEDLESNNAQKVEEFKFKLKEQFNATKDSWILYGIYDYYLSTNSSRAIDVLVVVKEPHDKHFFDKTLDGVRSNNRLQHLTLLGYIVRRKPIWLYKICHHQLFKELLKILRSETDIIVIVSTLLILNILIPTIPGLMGPFLPEIFNVFSKLAAMNAYSNNYQDVQLVHLQISLYTLFHRLYGMFPCNLISFLRKEYSTTETLPVFSHTVKPMLDTMRVNPLLITANEEWEITQNRWRNVESHDIIISCAKLLVNGGSSNRENSQNFYESKPTFNCEGLLDALKVTGKQTVADYCKQLSKVTDGGTILSPSVRFHETMRHVESTPPAIIPGTPIARGFEVSSPYSEHEGSSPPETAVEATPETTPIRSSSALVSPVFSNNRLTPQSKVPIDSFPNSPIKKDSSFLYSLPEISSINLNPFNSQSSKKFSMLLSDRHQPTVDDHVEVKPTLVKNSNQEKTAISSSVSVDKKERGLNHTENVFRPNVRKESTIAEAVEDFEGCEQEKSGSPCPSGGLHMPDHRSLSNFALQMKHIRNRNHSQSNSDSERFSPGHSPQDKVNFFKDAKVRRTNSWPEIKKINPNCKISESLTVPEECDGKQGVRDVDSNAVQAISRRQIKHGCKLISIGVQTDEIETLNFPYEHLFLDVFPPLHPSTAADQISPTESENSLEERTSSIYEKAHTPSKILQKYIEAAIQCHTDRVLMRENSSKVTLQTENKYLVDKLKLMGIQLQMEEHRREIHAERNRRLLGRSRRNKTLEEHNNALKDQVFLLQKDLENNAKGLMKIVTERENEIEREHKKAALWHERYEALQAEYRSLSNRYQSIEAQLKEEKNSNIHNKKLLNESKAALTDITNELGAYQKDAVEAKHLRSVVAELQAEILMSGEMISKYRDRITEISPLNHEIEQEMMKVAYIEDVKKLNKVIDGQQNSLDSTRNQIKTLKSEISEMRNRIENLEEIIKVNKDVKQRELKELEVKYEEVKKAHQQECDRANDLLFKLNHAKSVSKLSSTFVFKSTSASLAPRNKMNNTTMMKLDTAHNVENSQEGWSKYGQSVPKSPKRSCNLHSEEYQLNLNTRTRPDSAESEKPRIDEKDVLQNAKSDKATKVEGETKTIVENADLFKPIVKKKGRMECAETGQLKPLSITYLEDEASGSKKA